ncbi:spore protease YyaC [bacterium BFN5]|nr:spore protease YyaC [bacterium BFN5]
MMGKIVEKLTVNLADGKAKIKLYNHFLKLLEKQENYDIRPLIFLCIGSDRYTGDALGPLVGTHLEENSNCIIYGSLEHPVHAGNLVEIINQINQKHYYPIIIAIDACLGKSNEIGNMEIWEGGLHAGIAVGNRLPCVGHISIVGVVNAGGQIGYIDLQSTPLSIVIKLSKVIGESLVDSMHVMRSRLSEKISG